MAQPIKSKLTIYSIGEVSVDKEENSPIINCYPVEFLPNVSGPTNQSAKASSDVTDSAGNTVTTQLELNTNIQATWLGIGQSGRVTPPSVRKGERVLLFNVAGTEVYYWEALATRYDRRKEDKLMTAVNATKDVGNIDPIKMYYTLMDTFNQKCQFHSSKENGEYTDYDVMVDTKKGNIRWTDGMWNFMTWDSPSSTIHWKVNSHFIISAAGKDQPDSNVDSDDFKESYHYDVDNYKMHIREYLPRAVGKEQAAYDRKLDGANGVYEFKDDHGNFERLESVPKDYTSNIGHNVTKSIGNDRKITIGNNDTLTVGGDLTIIVDGTLSIKAKSFSIDSNGGDGSINTSGILKINCSKG